jgi:hypothetical protein
MNTSLYNTQYNKKSSKRKLAPQGTRLAYRPFQVPLEAQEDNILGAVQDLAAGTISFDSARLLIAPKPDQACSSVHRIHGEEDMGAHGEETGIESMEESVVITHIWQSFI